MMPGNQPPPPMARSLRREAGSITRRARVRGGCAGSVQTVVRRALRGAGGVIRCRCFLRFTRRPAGGSGAGSVGASGGRDLRCRVPVGYRSVADTSVPPFPRRCGLLPKRRYRGPVLDTSRPTRVP
jgi:hypothetical protein